MANPTESIRKLRSEESCIQEQGAGTGTVDDICAEKEKIVNQALQRAMACEDPDEEIRQFISFIGQRIDCERIYIFEQNEDQSYKNSYEWCAAGVASQTEYLQHIPLEDVALWLKTFAAGNYVCIQDVDAIADSDPAIYRWLKPQAIHSILVYPLFGGRCFFGADNPADLFLLETSSLMEIMAHFIETMLRRRDLAQKLRMAVFQNDQYRSLGNGVRYELNVVTGQFRYDVDQARELGYTDELGSLVQLREMIHAHPEFCDRLLPDGIEKAILRKENQRIEFISYRTDRTIRWNRITFRPFLDHNGIVLQLHGVLQDLSDQHMIVEQYNRYISYLSGGLHICYLSDPIHLVYASDDLCSFLGYSREEFERIVGEYYTEVIVEEDRMIFVDYVQRLAASPGIKSCEYRMRKKDGSIVTVIDTMESVDDGSGTMYGYAYILDKSEIHTMLEMVEENGRRSLAAINRQYEVLESLGRDYKSVFRVCLDDDRMKIIKMKGYVPRCLDSANWEEIPYYSFCREYIRERVYPEDQQKMMTAMHPDTVLKAFAKDDEYIVVYRVVDQEEIHFFQFKYVRLHHPEEKQKIVFAAGFKNIDQTMREEHAKNELLQGQLNIINAILRAFSFGFYFDYKRDTFVELSYSNGKITNNIGKEGNLSECLKRMKAAFPGKESGEIIDDFLNPGTIDARMEDRRFLSTQVCIPNYGWYEMYLLVVDQDDKGRIAHTIFAVRDISAEKEREEAYIRSLGISSRREQEAMQAAYVDALTGVMNRNAYERDFAAVDSCSTVGFIFCDLNNLKFINDNFGHEEGDRRLKEFASLLKEYFPAECLYRTGGDEFIGIIRDIDEAEFTDIVWKFAAGSAEAGNPGAYGTAYGSPSMKEELMRSAEIEMYRMKGEGRRVNPE